MQRVNKMQGTMLYEWYESLEEELISKEEALKRMKEVLKVIKRTKL